MWHPDSQSRAAHAWVAALCLALFVTFLTGCNSSILTSPSALSVVSQDDSSLRLRGDFNTAYYAYDSENAMTIVLIEGPEDQPTQAAAIRLMWAPKAGKTPITDDATNATIQYIVFADQRTSDGLFREVGIYNGAGFLFLDAEPGQSRLSASLWNADLLIADRSDNFRDLLGQSTLKGSFTAERNGEKVAQLLKRLNYRVSDRLGYPRLIRSQDADHERLAETDSR